VVGEPSSTYEQIRSLMEQHAAEKARADRAESDARAWEAKWLQEKMNAKAAAEKHAAEVAFIKASLAHAKGEESDYWRTVLESEQEAKTACVAKDAEIERLSRCLAQETERTDAVRAEHFRAVTESARKDAEIAAWKRATGRDDPEALDLKLGRAGIDTHLRVLMEQRDEWMKRAEGLGALPDIHAHCRGKSAQQDSEIAALRQRVEESEADISDLEGRLEEARRATDAQRERADALAAIYLPLSIRNGGPDALARYYRQTRDFIMGLQKQVAGLTRKMDTMKPDLGFDDGQRQ